VHDTGRQRLGDGKLSARPGVSSGFFEQGVFDEANRRRDDLAGYAAAGCVAKRRADVDPAGRRTAKGGDQVLQDSSTNTSAHGARYRFEEGAQDNILEKAADGISANRPAHDLDMRLIIAPDISISPFGPPDRMMPDQRGLLTNIPLMGVALSPTMPPFGSLRKAEHCPWTLMDRSSGVWAALYHKLLNFPSSGAHSRVGFARTHDNRIPYAGAVRSTIFFEKIRPKVPRVDSIWTP
jgi:hypothetical protein